MAEASRTNGRVPSDMDRLEELVNNSLFQRGEILSRFFGGERRDVFKECDYPDSLQADFYRNLFDRHAIAERIVSVYPKECWQVTPEVTEDESSKTTTDFEEAWDELSTQLHGSKSYYKDEEGSLLWSYLLKADILSGIGVYGVLLLGFDDGKLLEQPVDGVIPDGNPRDTTGVSQDIYGGQAPKDVYGGQLPLTSTSGTDVQYGGIQFAPMLPGGKVNKQRKLLFMRVFDETLVQVVQYEASMYSPRFGQPLMYMITLNDPRQPHTGVGLPLATVRVHWSRVIHIAETTDSPSEIFAKPRMRPAINNVLDTRKLYGSSAEGFWRAGFPGISLETVPSLGGDVKIDRPGLRDMMHNYFEGLDRALFLMGMSAKSLAPQVSDPTPQLAVQIEAICISLGCPVRVFKGSERGELASSQDDDAWLDRLRHRQNTYLTPKVIVPFVDRLIQVGVLPEPKQFHVKWPSLDSLSQSDKAQIANTRVQTISAYVSGNCETVLPLLDFYTRYLDFSEEEAKSILEDVETAEKEHEAEAQEYQEKYQWAPVPPSGFQMPPPGGGKGGPPQQVQPQSQPDDSEDEDEDE